MDVQFLSKLIMPVGIFVLTTGSLVVVRGLLLSFLHKWAKKTETELDDIIIKSIKGPSVFWCIAVGIYAGVIVSDMPERYVHYFTRAIDVLVILSVTLALSDLAGRIFRYYVARAALPIPGTGLAHGLIKGVILLLGFVTILHSIGVSITPILTALGVGGLAVALALQDTLANLFAGIHILMERPIRVGDFIKLETGQEGQVTDIGWRSTKIRMQPNNVVVIPNSKLSHSTLVNYSMPEQRMAVQIPIPVGYDVDPDMAESVILDTALKAVGEVPGLLAEPAPRVMLVPGFGENSLDYTLVCQIREFPDQYPVQHELRKRLLKRFREEGISMPYPQRTIHIIKGPQAPGS